MRSLMLLALLAGTAHADSLNCAFTTECFETDACQDTAYEFTVSYLPKSVSPAGVIAKATVAEQTQTKSGLFAQKGDLSMLVVGDAFDGTESKTIIGPDGQARHVVLDGENLMVVVYHGHCEGAV